MGSIPVLSAVSCVTVNKSPRLFGPGTPSYVTLAFQSFLGDNNVLCKSIKRSEPLGQALRGLEVLKVLI